MVYWFVEVEEGTARQGTARQNKTIHSNDQIKVRIRREDKQGWTSLSKRREGGKHRQGKAGKGPNKLEEGRGEDRQERKRQGQDQWSQVEGEG